MRSIFITILILFVCASCRFAEPFIGIPHGRQNVSLDSLKGKLKSHTLLYPCFRSGVHFGECTVTHKYNSKGRLIEKEVDKKSIAFMVDGNVRFFYKDIDYDTLGRKSRIHYTIFQNEGIGGYTVMDTIIIKQ